MLLIQGDWSHDSRREGRDSSEAWPAPGVKGAGCLRPDLSAGMEGSSSEAWPDPRREEEGVRQRLGLTPGPQGGRGWGSFEAWADPRRGERGVIQGLA